MRKFVLLPLMLLFIACATRNPSYFNSSVDGFEKRVDKRIIAKDMLEFITPYFKPQHTTFYFTTEDKDQKFFDYFAKSLRAKGYAITNNPKTEDLVFLSFKIRAEKNIVIAILSINESKVNFIYNLKRKRLKRVGTISSFNLEFLKDGSYAKE